MTKIIGVKPTTYIDAKYLGEIKQNYLVYDCIGIPMLKAALDFNIQRKSPSYINAELEYLSDLGIVKEVASKGSFMIKRDVNKEKFVPILNLFLKILNQNNLHPIIHSELYARFACFEIEMSTEYIDTLGYPISNIPQINLESFATKTDIIQVKSNSNSR